MQNNQNPVKNPGKSSTGFGFGLFVFAIQNRLNHLNIPVAERAPGKLVNGIGRFRKAESVQIIGYLFGRLFGFGNNPPVDRQLCLSFIKIRAQSAFVHFTEADGIP